MIGNSGGEQGGKVEISVAHINSQMKEIRAGHIKKFWLVCWAIAQAEGICKR